jgi:hypothetical protein
VLFRSMGAEFGPLHVAAALVNLMGWATLPFAPSLYRSFVGHPFSWRANTAIGDIEL